MKTKEGPPDGYGYGHVEGRFLYHLVKMEPWNNIAVCGKQVRHEDIKDVEGFERNVCRHCFRQLHK